MKQISIWLILIVSLVLAGCGQKTKTASASDLSGKMIGRWSGTGYLEGNAIVLAVKSNGEWVSRIEFGTKNGYWEVGGTWKSDGGSRIQLSALRSSCTERMLNRKPSSVKGECLYYSSRDSLRFDCPGFDAYDLKRQ